MSNKLIRVALMALLTIVSGLAQAETPQKPQTPKPAVILLLKLHPSDSGTPRVWKKIGSDPFTGNVLIGGRVLAKHTSIRVSEVREAWEMRRRGECSSYHLKNGDELRTTFGADRSMAAKIEFASATGDKERRGDVCLVRPDGTAVVFLDGCGNISVAWAEVRQPPPMVVEVPLPVVVPAPPPLVVVAPPPEPKKFCAWVPQGTTVRQTPAIFSSLNPIYVSVCGKSTYVAGLNTGVVGGETRSTSLVYRCFEVKNN